MMTHHDAEITLNSLQDILAAEREALLSGLAGTAAGMLEEKMQAMQAFEQLLADPQAVRSVPGIQARMETIIQLATENAGHFSAVRNGVNSAITRLTEASGNSYVGAYQSNGSNTVFSKAVGGYEKKA